MLRLPGRRRDRVDLAALAGIGFGGSAYGSALSVAICIVAALHYYEILKLRDRQPTVSVEMQVDALGTATG